MLSDDKLIDQIKYGNERAAEELITRYYASILRYCRWHCSSVEKAEDLTQEIFYKLFKNISGYQGKRKFKAYLYTIANRVCIDESRKIHFCPLEDEKSIVDRLTKQYGSKIAVDCVSATLKPGVYGLLGANGAGKTTLMRMLCAILESTSGEVLWNGKEITSLGADYRNVLGYLPQDFGYYPNYTAMEFLMYVAALKGIPKDMAKKRANELLEVVGLSNVANKKVKTFSGGMKQRVGIAQALLNNPGILILDEPTAGLDPKERVRFRNLLSEYAGDKIVILSTHIVSDVEAIADEVLLMKKEIYDSIQNEEIKMIWTVTDSEHTEMWLDYNQEYREKVQELLNFTK